MIMLVARDLLREAASRKWVIGLLVAITLALLLMALGLRFEVVDGALAATRFFGGREGGAIRPVDVALRPLFEGLSALIFGAGLVFGVLACADFAPSLLAPGRIEHLLSLPVRRWQLIVGTYLGVLILVLGAAVYGGAGLSLIIRVKTGVMGWAPLLAALLAAVAFSAVYALMMLAAVVVRSAATSGATGGAALLLFLAAGHRDDLAPLFSPGLGRGLFLLVTAPCPRLGPLAALAYRLAAGGAFEPGPLAVQLGGTLLFSAAALAVAVALFEGKDY